jgi:hypothetical protein
MPRTGRGLQLVDNVATMIEADSPYPVCASGELKLLILERMMIFPVALKRLQLLQWRNSHDRSEWKLLLVAHRVTACDAQLKAFYKILPGHLFDLTRQLQLKEGCKNLRGR